MGSRHRLLRESLRVECSGLGHEIWLPSLRVVEAEGARLFVWAVKAAVEVDYLKTRPCGGRRHHRRFHLVVAPLVVIQGVVVRRSMKGEVRIGLNLS